MRAGQAVPMGWLPYNLLTLTEIEADKKTFAKKTPKGQRQMQLLKEKIIF